MAITFRTNAAGARRCRRRRFERSDGRPASCSTRSGRRRVDPGRRSCGARARSDVLTSGSTTPAPTSSPARRPRCPTSTSWICCSPSTCVERSWLRGRRPRSSAAQPHGGVIINMSWDHVLTGMAGRNPEMFAAVKGGVLAFSKSLARSVAPRVRVNVLAPGWIETSFGYGSGRRHSRARSPRLLRSGGGARPRTWPARPSFSHLQLQRFITGQTMLVGGGVVM